MQDFLKMFFFLGVFDFCGETLFLLGEGVLGITYATLCVWNTSVVVIFFKVFFWNFETVWIFKSAYMVT